jgi:hypothetical protein
MLKFDAGNLISASDSEAVCCAGGGDSGEESFDVDDRIISDLSHKNGLVSMFTIAKLTDILEPFTKKKLSDFELNLFKSFYQRDATKGTNKGKSFNKAEELATKPAGNVTTRPLVANLTANMVQMKSTALVTPGTNVVEEELAWMDDVAGETRTRDTSKLNRK